MDPYHTLGVLRGCTRDEVKEAFRAMAWRAHPDRGGEELLFIRLCAAYKQILKDVERSPSSSAHKPARAPRNSRPPGPKENNQESGRPPSQNPASDERPPEPPDPTWEPDLILLDEEPRNPRPPSPPDPNWDPDMVLLDDEPGDGHAVLPPEEGADTDPYRAWLRWVSARSAKPKSVWRSAGFRAIGLIVFLAIVAANLWWCWAAWNDELEKDVRRAESIISEAQQQAAGRAD